MFPEAFVGGYPHSVMFNAMTEAHFKNEEEFQKYYSSAIDVPGKIIFPKENGVLPECGFCAILPLHLLLEPQLDK